MQDVYIVGATRTAIGNFMGALGETPVVELGKIVIEEAMKRAGITPQAVEEVIMGIVLQAGLGQNAARQSALKAGIPEEVPALSLNQVCGSGLKAVVSGVQAIKVGDWETVVAGGMENMTRSPYLLPKARMGYRMGNGEVIDSMINEGLWCAVDNCHMGITAENLAEKYNITREQQDECAYKSQMKAAKAIADGKFKDEIVPVLIPQRKGDPIKFETDEFVRGDTTLEKLSKLKPAFKKDGTVTAGNSSGINDGASAVVVMGEKKVKELGKKPLARIVSYASAGVDPSFMGIGPVPATRKALAKAGLKLGDIGLIEGNEAFAAQTLSVAKELGFNNDILNVNGGALALGHPIGASGCRILVSLLYEMHRRKTKYGLATLCIGGGMGIAMIVEGIY